MKLKTVDWRPAFEVVELHTSSASGFEREGTCNDQSGMTSSKETAATSLLLLEERLRRIDYVLHGNKERDKDETTPKPQHSGSASARLRQLEHKLHSLATKSPIIPEILALQKQHPTVFHPDSSSVPESLPLASLATLPLAHEKLYHSLSTQLQQLQDSSRNIPDPVVAAKLVELRPRIEKLATKQEQQMGELAELRARSAKVVETWYEGGVLEMGERWAEWEERLRDAEILVRRREAAKKREEGNV